MWTLPRTEMDRACLRTLLGAMLLVWAHFFPQIGWAARDFGYCRLTGGRWDSGWRGKRPSLYRVLSGSKSLSVSSATLVSAASVEVKKSKSGRPLLSWYHWMASPSETVRSFVAQGCFDLFMGAGKGGNTIESLVPRRSAVRAGLSVDRG